ncbi:MAG TPA: hypothetical protein DEP04_08325 [Dehalococcoidia bacterium]|nr:hypothetical protein [Chloroflexota bacterium]HCE76618.1 hypothetical protein [Dehalococcoidia bacterium]|tara:strand:- start:658 stop:1029 length:372 start_codon:yes stop_codon:yes gene_type:complete
MSNDNTIKLEQFIWDSNPSDKDNNFKNDVALYTQENPLPTLNRLSNNLNIPIGSIVRYIVCKWAMSGSESLLDLGPDMVKEIAGIFDAAEALGNDEERLKAYHSVKAIISWMKVPLEDPDYRN